MKSDKEFLLHIRDEIQLILVSTKNKSFDDFLGDLTLKRAVERSLEIIGEATKKLSPEFRNKHSKIEWRAIAGTRDKLIHDYMGVDYELVWDIVKNKIPNLELEIGKIIEKT